MANDLEPRRGGDGTAFPDRPISLSGPARRATPQHRRPAGLVALVGLALAALLLGACGGDDSSDDGRAGGGPGTTSSARAGAGSPTVPAPEAGTVEELLALGRPIVLAHAGGDDRYPHNTPYGFARGAGVGVDVLDMDVQLSADGVLVVHHDETVDRTTEASGRVADMTFAELHALDNAHWFTEACTCRDRPEDDYLWRGVRTGERPAPEGSSPDDFTIDSFRSIAERFPDHVLNIEIKGTFPEAVPAAEALARELRDLDRLDSAVVTSFDDEVVDAFHALAPEVEMSPGLRRLTDFVLAGATLEPWVGRILQVPPSYEGIEVFTADHVARSRAVGAVNWVWPNGVDETVDGYLRLLELGAEGINAADPEAGVAAVEQFQAER